jgi:hypothetical protein
VHQRRPPKTIVLDMEGGDRGQQLAAMADRGYADADQVVGVSSGHHFAIDIVVAECRCVLFKPGPRSHAATSMR